MKQSYTTLAFTLIATAAGASNSNLILDKPITHEEIQHLPQECKENAIKHNIEHLLAHKECPNGYLYKAHISAAPVSRRTLPQPWCIKLHCPNLVAQYPDNIDLSEANLVGADLSEAFLAGVDLSGANLAGANLEGANLLDANLSGACLDSANLTSAYLGGANLKNALLRKADLKGADLSGTQLEEAILDDAFLGGVDFIAAHLNNASLKGAHLTYANFMGADLLGLVYDKSTSFTHIILTDSKNSNQLRWYLWDNNIPHTP